MNRFCKNEIRNLNRFCKTWIDFVKNIIRNLRFPKFQNRQFENSKSILEMMIYKNAWNKKADHDFENIRTRFLKCETWIIWIQNSKINFLKTKSEICDFQNSKTDDLKIQNRLWKWWCEKILGTKMRIMILKTSELDCWLTKFYETKNQKWIFQKKKNDFLKSKSETKIQILLKPKTENKFSKFNIEVDNFRKQKTKK